MPPSQFIQETTVEQELLLSADDLQGSCSGAETAVRRSYADQNSRKPSRWAWHALILHFGLIIIYTLVFFYCWNVLPDACSTSRNLVYSPYIEEYRAAVFEHEHSVYVGKPSQELDAAWSKILENSNIRITETEMEHIPGRKDQAIRLPDGGYFASANVYHNLHCIMRLHRYMYKDHYFTNLTKEQQNANEFHANHCLDMLRQSVMCHGDMQLLTMKWRTDTRVPTANFSMPHKCVKWEKLEEWTASRRIDDVMKPGYLMHPKLGPAFPDGHGDPVGEVIPHSSM